MSVELRSGGFVAVTDASSFFNDQFIRAAEKNGAVRFPGGTEGVRSACSSCTFDGSSVNNNCDFSQAGDFINTGSRGVDFFGRSGRSRGSNDLCCAANTCLGGVLWTNVFSIEGSPKQVFFEYEASFVEDLDWFDVVVALYEAPAGLVAGDEPSQSDLDANKIVGTPTVDRGSSKSLDRDVFRTSSGEPEEFGAGNYFIGFYAASYDATGNPSIGASVRVQDFGFVP